MPTEPASTKVLPQLADAPLWASWGITCAQSTGSDWPIGLEMSIRGHCGLSLALVTVASAVYAQGLQQSATLPAPSALTSRPCGTNSLAQYPAAAR